MKYYIGVMSGTSLDGIDIVITDLSQANRCQLIAAHTYAFPNSLKNKIQFLLSEQKITLTDFGELDIELGQTIALFINQLLQQQQLQATDIIAVGSHGQTVFHAPNHDHPFSLQVGNAHVISELTGITTIADFRQRDIAAKGQGAPLVPAFHQQLFSHDLDSRIIVNIGGISNITSLPAPNCGDVIGFDTGPGNVLMNGWIAHRQQKDYDKNGQWAASGRCHSELLNRLLDTAYFQQNIPKSTGRELFNMPWLTSKLASLKQAISPADVQATLLQFTAQTIADSIKTHANQAQSIYVCGGGAHNGSLMRALQLQLSDKQVTDTTALGLHPDWVEACAFAWLASRTLNQKSGNLPSVTGAKHSSLLGAVYWSNSAS